jgi:hypothetical protein
MYTRVGTGDPLAFSDWASNVSVGTLAQATNLTAALAAYTLPEADGENGQLLGFNGAGALVPSNTGRYDDLIWIHSANVTTIDFTDLENYRYLEVTYEVAMNDELYIKVSNNNGTSFHNSGYLGAAQDDVSQDSNTSGMIMTAAGNPVTQRGFTRISHLNSATLKTVQSGTSFETNNDRCNAFYGTYDSAIEVHDAIRFRSVNGTTNFTAGWIHVRGYY